MTMLEVKIKYCQTVCLLIKKKNKKNLTSNPTWVREEGGQIDSWGFVFLKIPEPGDIYFLLQKVLINENHSENEKTEAV